MTSPGPSLRVEEVGPEAAAEVLSVVRQAFGARPRLDPPTTALDETEGSMVVSLGHGGGVLVRRDGVGVGALVFDTSRPGLLGMQRVGVVPAHQGHGVASVMVGMAEDVAAARGLDGTWLTAREELPETVVFWVRRGYVETARAGRRVELAKALGVAVPVPTADDTRALGERLAGLLRPGDLLVLGGGLGAGKTTLTQGIGAGLGVRGAVTSPTFVIARVHPSEVGGPDLVHVDAYRLGGVAELDDLDLDLSLRDAVTVVEWGQGLAEGLAESRLEVRLEPADPGGGEPRVVCVRPYGVRWVGARLRSSLLAS